MRGRALPSWPTFSPYTCSQSSGQVSQKLKPVPIGPQARPPVGLSIPRICYCLPQNPRWDQYAEPLHFLPTPSVFGQVALPPGMPGEKPWTGAQGSWLRRAGKSYHTMSLISRRKWIFVVVVGWFLGGEEGDVFVFFSKPARSLGSDQGIKPMPLHWGGKS